MQLCAAHSVDRDNMISQASKSRQSQVLGQGRTLVHHLTEMELKDPAAFLDHLADFCAKLLDMKLH